jgi:hypothetical protein
MRTNILKGLLIFCFTLISSGSRLYGLEILYPLYSYPNWYDTQTYLWDEIADAADQVDITAIINPSNGPGGSGDPNADYLYGLSDLAAGGVNMMGYVFTDYGNRPIADVKADIDKYYTDYVFSAGLPFSGVFFDEAASGADQALEDYYGELYAYAKSYAEFDTVVLNHGINASESYTQYADINIVYEGSYTNWLDYDPDAYLPDYSADQFGAFVHSTSSASDMENAIDLAVDRGIDNLLITNDMLVNPWDTLPEYWDQEIDKIAAVNQVPEPTTFWLMLPVLIGLYAGRKFRLKP